MAQFLSPVKFKAYDASGNPASLGWVYSYAAGTSTNQSLYQDAAGTPYSNPFQLDANGEAVIYFSGNYKIDVKTSALVDCPGYPIDNVVDAVTATASVVNNAITLISASVGFVVTQYGAVGNSNGTAGSGTDDSAAIRLASAALIANGGGKLIFPAGKKYRVFSDGITTPLGAFTGLNGVEIDMTGAELVVDRTFAPNTEINMFTFANCQNTSLPSTNIICTQTQSVGNRTHRGAVIYEFTQGCTDIFAGVTSVTDISRAWSFRRGTSDPVSYSSRAIDLGVTHALRCGYGIFGTLSGYGVRAVLHTESCGRSYFVTGGYDHDVHVYSKNHEGSIDCLITTDAGLGMEDLRLKYVNKESTTTDSSIDMVGIQFQDGDLYAGKIRNIEVDLDVETDNTRYMGYAVRIDKLTSADVPDPTDRGHTLENIKIKGRIKGNSGSQRSLNLMAGGMGTWGAGENVYGIDVSDLIISGTSQPSINLTSLKKVGSLRNIYSSAQINLTGNTTENILCENVRCDGSLTSSTADTSWVTYVNCLMDSGNQSRINKQFVNSWYGTAFYRKNPTQFKIFRNSSTQTLADNTATKVQFNLAYFDDGAHCDVSTNYRYTADAKDKYQFAAAVDVSGTLSAGDAYWIALYKNGTSYAKRRGYLQNAGGETLFISDEINLDVGDYVEVYVLVNHASGTHLINYGSDITYFSGS